MWLEQSGQFAEEPEKTPIFWDDMPLKGKHDVYDPMG